MKIACIAVKDVIFGEDAAPFSNYNAATNWSFIRTITINIARMCGYDSLTKAKRFPAHDIDKLFSLLEGIIPGGKAEHCPISGCFGETKNPIAG